MTSSPQRQSVVPCDSCPPHQAMNDIENASPVHPFLTDGSAIDHQAPASPSYCLASQSAVTVLSQTGREFNPQPLSMRLTPCSGPQTYLGITSFHVATLQMKPASSHLPDTDGESAAEAWSVTAHKTPGTAPRTTRSPAEKAPVTSTKTPASVAVKTSALPAVGTGIKSPLSLPVTVKTSVLPALTVSPLALKLASESLTPLPQKTLVRKSHASLSTTTPARKNIVLVPRRTEVEQPRQLQNTLFSTELVAPPPQQTTPTPTPAVSPPQDMDTGSGRPPDLACPRSPQVVKEEEESPQMLNEKKGKKGLMVWAKGLGPGGPVLMKRSSVFKYKPKVVDPNRRIPFPGYTKIRLSPLDPEPPGASVAETAAETQSDATEKSGLKTSSAPSSEDSGKEKSLLPPGSGNLRLVGFLMPSPSLQTGATKEMQAPTFQSVGGGPSPALQPTDQGPATAHQSNPSEKEQTSKKNSNVGLPGASLVNPACVLALYAPSQATTLEPHKPTQSGQPGEGDHADQNTNPSVQQVRNVGYLIPVQSLRSVPLELPAPCKGPNDMNALASPHPNSTAQGSNNNNNWFLQCKTCLARFCNREHLNQHINTVPCHRCSRCNLNFTTEQELSRHRLTHKNRQRQRCEYCDQLCANIKSLRLHEKRWHPAALAHDRVNCSVCKSVLTRTKLREHLQVDKNFYCLECYSCFYTSKELDTHIEKSHGVWMQQKGEKRKQPEPTAVGKRPPRKKRKPHHLTTPQESGDPTALSVTSQSPCDITTPAVTSQSPCDLTTPTVTSQSSSDLETPSVTLQSPCDLATPTMTLQSSCDLATPSMTSQSPCDLTTPTVTSQSSSDLETPSVTLQSSCDLATPSMTSQSPCDLTTPTVTSQSSSDLATPSVTSQSPCDLTAPTMTLQSSSDPATPFMTSQSPCDLATPAVTSQSPCDLATPSLTLQLSCDLATSLMTSQSPCDLTTPTVTSQSSDPVTPSVTSQSPCDLATPSVTSQSPCDLATPSVTS